MTTKLRPGERLDDLQLDGYEIIQNPERFCFGIDAVLQMCIRYSNYADVAQLAEQLICNQQVIGSSPIIGFISLEIRKI